MFTCWTGKKFAGAWTDKEAALRYAAPRGFTIVAVDLSQSLDSEVAAMAATIQRELEEKRARLAEAPKVSLQAVSIESNAKSTIH